MDRQGIGHLSMSVDTKVVLSTAHKIIVEGLNKNLDALQPEMYNAVQYAVDKALGAYDSEWHEVPLMDTISEVVDSVVTRVIFGVPLSRNKSFLKVLHGFLIAAGVLTEFVGQLPYGLLRCLCALPLSLYISILQRMSITYLRPRVREVLLKIEDEGSHTLPPEDSFDFVTQCVRTVRKLKHPVGVAEETFVAEILMFLVS